MSNCSILVNSCDKYCTAWPPFFALFRKYWPNCEYPVYLNTEHSQCKEKGVQTLNSVSNSWSSRLRDSLSCVETDYLIMLLEDFFLMDYVKTDIIEEFLDTMRKDPSIAVIYPKQIRDYDQRDNYHPSLIRMDTNTNHRYLINFQAGIWRREALLNLINEGLTPWQIERETNLTGKTNYKFYCYPFGSKYSCQDDVIPYLFAIENGYGIARSKWLWNNKSFFKKEGILVDMKELGVMTYPLYLYDKLLTKLGINK